ncbi:dipeptide-binding ABC transporter, periplasmic substrate-binding component [Klebsiella pneumoniae]|uniref:Dipeptide-binding ABC transporter, periplasmic substrate-binding component n=1 Tax=Klebsiella pneumoniae TaxID=573 RepID=A0A4P0Y081_KLEPN|nr:dipeptide-binding ABC transporter, periplasmic substrate-binding component [Klebsiella pneumoniae]
MFYTGWSASTGEADWALSPLFASQKLAADAVNTRVLPATRRWITRLSEALKTTDPQPENQTL